MTRALFEFEESIRIEAYRMSRSEAYKHKVSLAHIKAMLSKQTATTIWMINPLGYMLFIMNCLFVGRNVCLDSYGWALLQFASASIIMWALYDTHKAFTIAKEDLASVKRSLVLIDARIAELNADGTSGSNGKE